jgi:hypothetical protein
LSPRHLTGDVLGLPLLLVAGASDGDVTADVVERGRTVMDRRFSPDGRTKKHRVEPPQGRLGDDRVVRVAGAPGWSRTCDPRIRSRSS